jgi:hypothetical protein
MSQWASQFADAVSLSDLAAAARQAGEDAAVCVFVPDETVEFGDRRGYAALVIAYSRFEEPVAILEDGGTALLIREGGVAAAAAVAARILAQAARMGLASRLRAGVAALSGWGSVEAALRWARTEADAGEPGQIAGAA